MTDPIHAASMWSFDDFFAEFGPEVATYMSPSTGQTVLGAALRNGDLAARYAIANRLLDEGADPAHVTRDGVNSLHVALGPVGKDLQRLIPLVQRLLDGGADPNQVARKFGTPLQMVTGFYATPEEELRPLYDLFFSRDDLDLLKVGAFKQSTLSLARKSTQFLPELERRMEQYLEERGIPVPPE